jgi:hypothetical protein
LLRGHDNNEINYRLRAVRLAAPSDDELNDKREELYELFPEKYLINILPGPKYDLPKFIKANKKRVAALGIDELIKVMLGTRNKHWEDAMLLITDKAYRMPVKSMLLSGQDCHDVLKTLNSTFQLDVDLEALELFKKYFWDVVRMTKLEVYHYISTIEGAGPRQDLLDAFHKKTEKVRWKVTGESMVTFDKILTTIMTEAFEKFKSYIAQEDGESMTKTIKWADLAIKAAEKHSKLASKDNTDAIEELRFSLEKLSQDEIKSHKDFDGEIG